VAFYATAHNPFRLNQNIQNPTKRLTGNNREKYGEMTIGVFSFPVMIVLKGSVREEFL